MYKEACRTPFSSNYLLSGSWYVSQSRVHYQEFLNHGFSVLDIKPVMKLPIKPLVRCGSFVYLKFLTVI